MNKIFCGQLFRCSFSSVKLFSAQNHSTNYLQSRLVFSGTLTKNSPRNGWRVIGGIMVSGTVLGSIYKFAYKPNFGTVPIKLNVSGSKSVFDQYLLKSLPPEIAISRTVGNSGKNPGDLKLTLYQFQSCPFCCKTRAYLDYFGWMYDVVEVNSIKRTEVKWSPNYKKVPILLVECPDGKLVQLRDSSMIISSLTSFLLDPTRDLMDIACCYPKMEYVDEKGKSKQEISNRHQLMLQNNHDTGHSWRHQEDEELVKEQKWRVWVDETLVHTLSPNIYRTPREALQSFRVFDVKGDWANLFSVWERRMVVYIGAAAMWVVGKILKRRHHLENDVRKSLYNDISNWTSALEANKTPFMGGLQPDLADLAVYGVLSAIDGCEAFNDMLKNTKIDPWYHSMQGLVNSAAGKA